MSGKRLFNLEEAAQYLSMSTRLLEDQIAAGEIPVKRIPGVRRNFYDVRDLDKFADNLIPYQSETRAFLEVIRGKRA